MLHNILDTYTQLKGDHDSQQKKENDIIEEQDKEIIKNFLLLYDKDVKMIHTNEEHIEKNLQALYSESVRFGEITKEAIEMHDKLTEYFKEVGDLYNWATQLEEAVNDVQSKVIKPKVEEDKLDT